jgi:ribosomal protein S12 methylthiotransferase accessory factor
MGRLDSAGGVRARIINRRKISEPQFIEFDDFINYQEMCSYLGYFNLVKKVDVVLAPSSELPMFIGNCEFLNINYLFNYLRRKTSMSVRLNESIFAGGKGFTMYKAICSSLGEAFERLMACLEFLEQKDSLVDCTYLDLAEQGMAAIHPSRLRLFSAEQFEGEEFLFDEFEETTRLKWTRMQDYRTGGDIWVPACLMMMFYEPATRDEKRIGYATSGGLTSHFLEQHGVDHGLLEIMERHEINLSWYCKVRPQEIVIDETTHPKLAKHRDYIREKKVRFFRHNVDQQHFHVVTAMSFDEDMTKYAFNAGGGIDADIEQAITSAMEEYTQAVNNTRRIVYAPNWTTSRWSNRVLDVNEDDDPREFKTFYQAVSYYGLACNRAKLDWYVRDNEQVLLSELRAQQPLLSIHEYVEQQGLQPVSCTVSLANRFDHIYITKVFMAEYSPAFIAGVPALGHPTYAEYLAVGGEINQEILPFP